MAEVFTVAWRRLADVPQGDRALHWLYGVARLTLANHRRTMRRRRGLLTRLASQPAAVAHDRSDDPEVLTALAQLREHDREILMLAAWEQLSANEIASVLGCTANAAALRLSRARKRLRKQLTAQSHSRTQSG